MTNRYYIIDADDRTARCIDKLQRKAFKTYIGKYSAMLTAALALSTGWHFYLTGDVESKVSIKPKEVYVAPKEDISQEDDVDEEPKYTGLPNQYIEPSPAPIENVNYVEVKETPVDVYVNTYMLNIRSMYSEDSEILRVAGYGEPLKVTAVVNTVDDGLWLRIDLEGDGDAYARSEYITEGTSPVIEEITQKEQPQQVQQVVQKKVLTPGPIDGNQQYVGDFLITYYCGCVVCCGTAGNPTASGVMPTAGRTIAADPSIPFGTRLIINGYEYVVEDRGGAIKGNHIDIYENTHAEALNHNVVTVPVYRPV